MRGYLQRLAASVSRPERRVRPFAGSIFADNLREESAKTARPLVVEQNVERVAREPVTREAAAIEPARATGPATQEPAGVSRPVAAELAHFAPLLSGKVAEAGSAESAVQPLEEASRESPTQPHLQPKDRRHKEEPERETLLSGAQANAGRLVVQSLVFEEGSAERSAEAGAQLVPTREPTRREPLRTVAAQAARRGAQKPTTTSRAPGRGASEEIQIHIGRIEVIATAPQPARAAAAPSRRFTSLDDYLKRRDGRRG
jgi:hypothetical protein